MFLKFNFQCLLHSFLSCNLQAEKIFGPGNQYVTAAKMILQVCILFIDLELVLMATIRINFIIINKSEFPQYICIYFSFYLTLFLSSIFPHRTVKP